MSEPVEEVERRVGNPLGLVPREWLIAGLLGLAFLPALLDMARIWSSVDYQSHGFLVPVVAAWVAMRERPRRRGLEIRSDLRGLWVLAAALLLYLVGAGAGLTSLEGLGLVVAVSGAVLFTRGAAWLRALAFPLGFLIFMVPVPPPWITPTIVKLQLFVSEASVRVVQAFGVALTRNGNVLVLPEGGTLFVAEACSGVTSIVTLTPLAVLLGYFTLRSFSTRALLVVAVVPLAMAGNLTRVVVTVALAQRFGTESATSGLFHESAGMLIYAVACGLMLGLGALLRQAEVSLGWTSQRA